MNKLKTSDVVDPNILQPFTAISAAFLQDTNLDMLVATVRGIVGESYSQSVPYAIAGVTYTGTAALPTSVAPGYILYGSNLIGVNSGFGPAATGARFDIVTTNTFTYNGQNADPLTFTDGIARNVHNIYKFQITDAASGGLFGLTQVVFLSGTGSWTTPTLTNSWSVSPNGAKYRVLKDSVMCNGAITNATVANAALSLFTLPVGSRPLNDTFIPIILLNSGTYYTRFCSISATTGEVLVDVTGLANVTTTAYLTGIRFFTS